MEFLRTLTRCFVVTGRAIMTKTAMIVIMMSLGVTVVKGVPVDVALNRPITAYITCGALGAEEFISQRFLWSSGDVRINNTLVCYSASVYPPAAIVDGNDSTWWQSTARPNFNQTVGGGGPDVVISIDLQQVFEIQVIILKMGESLRPRRIVFYKSSTDLVSLQPWIFRVQSEQNCTKLYNVPPGPANVVSVTSTLCQIYLTGPQTLDEVIMLDLTQVTVPNWRNGRFLKIEFYDIDLTLGVVGIPFQHYTVRTMNVMAECTCNGQQTACSQSNVTGTFECVCGNNTQGTNCESCRPYFNQFAYRYGTACESCNCFGHSNVCIFDPNVANSGGSLNSMGVRLGGGVCQGCNNLTAGYNCELCQPLFYRPFGVPQTSASPCVPCNCSGPGMQVTGLIGDCVMSDNISISVGMMPGDCYCKRNVAGRQCDRCKDGSYNMSPINPDGCQSCSCFTNGTVGGSIICNAVGQCVCKQFVTNTVCDTCKDGYYGLDASKPDGCTICSCDIGGSLPGGCSKDVGACTCRVGVTSTTCSIPSFGYYSPEPHFISAEFENLRAPFDTVQPGYSGFGYVTSFPTRPASAVVTPPFSSSFSDQYQAVIRYSAATPGVGTVSVAGIDKITTATVNMSFTACPGRWCYAPLGTLNLPKGLGSTVAVTVTSTIDPRLLLDRVVAVPVEYLNTTNLFGAAEDAKFQTTCNVAANGIMSNPTTQQYCQAKMFSLSTYYLNGALQCGCNFLGSSSNGSCEPYGGQCPCKPGTTGRMCDSCAIQFFGLNSLGCQACNCSNTATKACDNAGICLCPPGVEGASCDHCMASYYNYDYLRGCIPCDCNGLGSLTPFCNTTTGFCSCQPGVVGTQCDQCADGFWQMSLAGCLQCSCDPSGSLGGTLCDKVSGQCTCKKNVQNQQCTSCTSTSFAKSPTHIDGCLSCVCMGITNVCQSAITFFQQTTPVVPLFNASLVPQIAVVTATLLPSGNGVIRQVIDNVELAETQVKAAQVVYWQAPSLTGNLLQYYEGTVSFAVSWISIAGVLPSTNPKLLLIGRDNVPFYFAFPVVSVPPNNLTNVNVVLSLENVIAAGQITATRAQLLIALTRVQAVLIPASYAPQDHVSRLGNVTYTMNPTNVEQCFCPPGYEGLSCENCSSGLMKTNVTLQGYLGSCVPCSCNGHSQLCMPETGQCINCMDNTAGFNCEVCAVGYYRDILLGPGTPCLPCPCTIPRVTNSSCAILNGTVSCLQCSPGYTGSYCDSCLPFYYGTPQIPFVGSCTPCTCNNNTNTCDPITGQCLNCSFNTNGLQCEKCMDGFFGDASKQNCSACGCSQDGSLGPICNNQTGQCSCISGVGRRTCDQCLDYYYHPFDFALNAPAKYCIPCNCSMFGSSNLSCNANGVCPCNLFTTGTKCDTCAATYFGLPMQSCQYCNCSVIGTVAGAVSVCDPVSGQCQCLPGVTGRRCDSCLPMYYNMSIAGCTACGLCESSLGNDTMALMAQFQTYWNQTLVFQMIQQQDSILVGLQGTVANVVGQTGLFSNQDMVYNLTELVQTMQQSSAYYQANISSLTTQLNDISVRASQLLTDALTQYTRIGAMKAQADQVRVTAGTQYVNVQNNIQTLLGYNTSAYQLLLTIQGRPLNLTFNWGGLFTTENLQALDELGQARNALNNVIQFNNTVANQVSRANALQATLQQLSSSFSGLTNTIGSLNSNGLSISARLAAVVSKYNITLSNKLNADNLWASVLAMIASTDAILRQAQSSLTAGQQFVADCQTIINGVPFGPLPINTTVDLTGITGWNQVYNLVIQQLQLISASLTNYTVAVSAAERKANELSQQAQSILITYQSVQSRGQPAVDAIDGFLRTIQLIDQSLQAALAANTTMQQVLSQLQAASIGSMELSANQSLANSLVIKSSLDALLANVSASNYNGQLDAANASLQNAIQNWAQLDLRVAALNVALTSLQGVASNLTLDADLSAGNLAANAALQSLASVVTQSNQLQSTVAAQTTAVATMQSDVANASLTQAQLSANVSAFRNQLNNIGQSLVLGINSSQSEIGALQPVLSQSLDSLVARLAAVVAKMAALEQPVSFAGTSFETIANPDSGVSRLYNSVGLDFVTNQLKGVLFFAENNSTREKVLVQLVNSSIVFEYSNVDETNTAVSPATLEVGVWYRVYATRYAYDGQLSVTRMMTGGIAVTPMRTVSSTNTQLTLNSPLYIGGLALSFENRPKVYDNGIPFSGCIYSVLYNGAPVPLWQSILRKDSTASCCRKPSPIPSAATFSPCVTLYGFGYVSFNPRISFSVTSQAQVALQFRTFAPEGVILTVSAPNTADYYCIYMTAGTVAFSISSLGSFISVQTSNLYNDGQWYQLKAVHNPSSIQLSVLKMNQSAPSQPEVKQLANLNFNLLSLANAGFTIGGQTPGIPRGPIATSFPGCVQDFQHSNALTSSLDLQPDSLSTGINSSSNVDLTKCLFSVISGLGFLNTASYASLRSISSPIQTVSFELVTTVPSGVIAYFQLPQNFAVPSNLFLYIALYNGDMFILFNQGQGVQPAFRSRGNYLSDGRIHRIVLDFTFTNSPRMTIYTGDTSETHVGMMVMTPYFNLLDNSVYVGGVPSSVGIDSTSCPVRISLVGGIRNLLINNGLINFFNPNSLSGNNVQGIYLSGLPTPLTVLPPPPYTTLTPPVTALPPTCVTPQPFAYLNNSYLNFAGTTNSYVAYNLGGLESSLENAFSVRISFRALQANGILLFLPGSPFLAPAQYFAIYMYGGYIRASMSTNSSSAQTKNLQSLYTYNDGKWHEVEVLRVNDFLAIIIAESKDYINNQVLSVITSKLTIGSTVYLGGIPSSLGTAGYPFDSANIVVGIKSFQGCISNISLVYFALQSTILDSSREQSRQNVVPCQATVTNGMFLNSANSYVRVADSLRPAPTFDLVPGFTFSITYKASVATGTLMTAWSSNTRFVALVLTLGQVQVLMSTVTSGQLFSVTSRAQPSPLSVCDGNSHTAVFSIANTYVTLQIDSFAVETFQLSGTTYIAPQTVPIYVGGVRDSSWSIPGMFNPISLSGCIQTVTINGQAYYVSESSDYQSATSGCPS